MITKPGRSAVASPPRGRPIMTSIMASNVPEEWKWHTMEKETKNEIKQLKGKIFRGTSSEEEKKASWIVRYPSQHNHNHKRNSRPKSHVEQGR
jgi:hypothetical protein